MTIVIPSWLISLFLYTSAGVIIISAIIGIYVLVMLMGDNWWI